MDFVWFWEQIAVGCLCLRLHMIFGLASSEEFSKRCFKAYSATARLKWIATVVNALALEVE